MDAKASTPRGSMESKPQRSWRAGRGLKGSWRAELGDVPVHGKKLLCNPPHKHHCTKPTLASGLRKLEADDANRGKASISRRGDVHNGLSGTSPVDK